MGLDQYLYKRIKGEGNIPSEEILYMRKRYSIQVLIDVLIDGKVVNCGSEIISPRGCLNILNILKYSVYSGIDYAVVLGQGHFDHSLNIKLDAWDKERYSDYISILEKEFTPKNFEIYEYVYESDW